jgi:hypothetical protein
VNCSQSREDRAKAQPVQAAHYFWGPPLLKQIVPFTHHFLSTYCSVLGKIISLSTGLTIRIAGI